MKILCCDPEYPQCKTPVAEIQDGELIIIARHHGERHVSRFSLKVLIGWLRGKRNGSNTTS